MNSNVQTGLVYAVAFVAFGGLGFLIAALLGWIR